MRPPALRTDVGTHGTAGRGTWDAEYAERGAIPSSHRDAPSTALVELLDTADVDRRDAVLDVGCGNGRNAVYLAETADRVVGVDFSPAALALARERVRDEPGTVGLFRGDVRHGIPLPDDAVELVVDSYVSCHFLSDRAVERYADEVRRVLRPGGRLYWSALSVEDAYYRQLSGTHPDEGVVVDPLNDVPKRLYTADQVMNGVADRFLADHVAEVSFTDTVDGRDYERAILAAIYRVAGDG